MQKKINPSFSVFGQTNARNTTHMIHTVTQNSNRPICFKGHFSTDVFVPVCIDTVWTNKNKIEYSFGTEQKRRASGVLLHRKEGGKNWQQQPLLKMDLCKKLQSYLNTIFLGMASLLTSFVFF